MAILDAIKVKQFRLEKEISSRSNLAKEIGITKNQLSFILSNKFDPVKLQAKNILEFLNVSVLEVMTQVDLEEGKTFGKTTVKNIPVIDKDKVEKIMSRKNINTWSDLADLIDISKKKLLFLLSDEFIPVKKVVIRIAAILEVSVFDIIKNGKVKKEREPNYNRDKSNINVLELFAGAGGLALGISKAGLNTVGLIEVDNDCCKTLKNNRPNWNVINKDIKEVDFNKFDSDNIDVVSGGFPCQSFSDAGKKLGFEDTRGTLFFEFARAVKKIKPKVFVAENVPGIVRHDNGKTLETILKVMSDLGYNVKYKKLNSANYFVPQKRKRVFIVGTLPGITFEFPEPFDTVVTIREALRNCPDSEGVEYSKKRKKVYEQVPSGGYWRDLPEKIQKEFMGKSYNSGGGRTGIARRMSWDQPCLTLMTTPAQKRTERIHPKETRPFKVREYARLQTFPDEWEFNGSTRSKYKQIGNAVPVKLGYFIGDSIRESFENIESNKSDKKQMNLYNAI
jgi:DNA (cytosine-5)-methyltransferase 1